MYTRACTCTSYNYNGEVAGVAFSDHNISLVLGALKNAKCFIFYLESKYFYCSSDGPVLGHYLSTHMAVAGVLITSKYFIPGLFSEERHFRTEL